MQMMLMIMLPPCMLTACPARPPVRVSLLTVRACTPLRTLRANALGDGGLIEGLSA